LKLLAEAAAKIASSDPIITLPSQNYLNCAPRSSNVSSLIRKVRSIGFNIEPANMMESNQNPILNPISSHYKFKMTPTLLDSLLKLLAFPMCTASRSSYCEMRISLAQKINSTTRKP